MSGKGKAGKKAPNKAEQQALLAAANKELSEKMLQAERQLIYAEERRWEAALLHKRFTSLAVTTAAAASQLQQYFLRLAAAAAAAVAALVLLAPLPCCLICGLPQLKTVQRDLGEKKKWRHLMSVELDRHFRELQQQEAADARVLQQQLQQKQQQQQQQQQLQKQIIMQKDVELLDTEQAIKGQRNSSSFYCCHLNSSSSCRNSSTDSSTNSSSSSTTNSSSTKSNSSSSSKFQTHPCSSKANRSSNTCSNSSGKLKSRSERVYEEFLSLVQDVVSQMHERLCLPETTGQRTIEAFNTHIETIKKDMIANIEAFFAVKKESQTLGGAWRGLGLVPPSAVTQLGV
ncbi:hypothetical protein Emed_005846 [Eimeria media]